MGQTTYWSRWTVFNVEQWDAYLDLYCARVPNRGKCICGEWSGDGIIHGTAKQWRKCDNGLYGNF
jgi:hypothetical protein